VRRRIAHLDAKGSHIMDVPETTKRTGLCTEQGTKHPEGARVSELIWSQSGMPSGAKAWDLSHVGHAISFVGLFSANQR
jgi:hypothetical protein